jgi:hypothetical protein
MVFILPRMAQADKARDNEPDKVKQSLPVHATLPPTTRRCAPLKKLLMQELERERPTSNAQHPTLNDMHSRKHPFDVGSWTLSVGCSSFFPHQPPPGVRALNLMAVGRAVPCAPHMRGGSACLGAHPAAAGRPTFCCIRLMLVRR